MLISNGIKCECYFPYGGTDRGTSIRPGEFSKTLPSSRFVNKLLQKDWQKGTIKVYLTKEEIVTYTLKLAGVQTYPVKEGPAAGMFLLSKGVIPVSAPAPIVKEEAPVEKPIAPPTMPAVEVVEPAPAPVEEVETVVEPAPAPVVEKSEPEAVAEIKEEASADQKPKKSRKKKNQTEE